MYGQIIVNPSFGRIFTIYVISAEQLSHRVTNDIGGSILGYAS